MCVKHTYVPPQWEHLMLGCAKYLTLAMGVEKYAKGLCVRGNGFCDILWPSFNPIWLLLRGHIQEVANIEHMMIWEFLAVVFNPIWILLRGGIQELSNIVWEFVAVVGFCHHLLIQFGCYWGEMIKNYQTSSISYGNSWKWQVLISFSNVAGRHREELEMAFSQRTALGVAVS